MKNYKLKQTLGLLIPEKTREEMNARRSKRTKPQEMLDWMQSLAPIASDKPLIRFGPDDDGGYLLPDDLKGIEACFSPGVSSVSGFEKSCANLGMKVFLADKSVAKPADDDDLVVFTPKFIGATSNADFMTLDSWVSDSLPDSDGDLLLQMDIEGYEYETLFAASDALIRRFRILIIEFHRLDDFWDRAFFLLGSRVFGKLLQTHHCVHIHPNNCCGASTNAGLTLPRVMEFTFVRKDRVSGFSYQRQFPHPLDANNSSRETIVLPKCWYRGD